MPRNYTWDPAKDRNNIREHGIGFDAADRFEWNSASIEVDSREDYGELREFALGFIGDVLYGLVFVQEEDDEVRIISLRKANKKERQVYARRPI